MEKPELYLSWLISTILLRDESWQSFGYDKRPKTGIFSRIFLDKDKNQKENFLARELTLLICIDIVCAIHKISELNEIQKIGLISKTLALITGPFVESRVFKNSEDLTSFFLSGLNDYLAETKLLAAFYSRVQKKIGLKIGADLLVHGALFFADPRQGLIYKQSAIINKLDRLVSNNNIELTPGAVQEDVFFKTADILLKTISQGKHLIYK